MSECCTPRDLARSSRSTACRRTPIEHAPPNCQPFAPLKTREWCSCRARARWYALADPDGGRRCPRTERGADVTLALDAAADFCGGFPHDLGEVARSIIAGGVSVRSAVGFEVVLCRVTSLRFGVLAVPSVRSCRPSSWDGSVSASPCDVLADSERDILRIRATAMRVVRVLVIPHSVFFVIHSVIADWGVSPRARIREGLRFLSEGSIPRQGTRAMERSVIVVCLHQSADLRHRRATLDADRVAVFGAGVVAVIGAGVAAVIGAGVAAVIGAGVAAVIGAGVAAVIGAGIAAGIAGVAAVIGAGVAAVIGAGVAAVIGAGVAVIGAGVAVIGAAGAVIGAGVAAVIGAGVAAVIAPALPPSSAPAIGAGIAVIAGAAIHRRRRRHRRRRQPSAPSPPPAPASPASPAPPSAPASPPSAGAAGGGRQRRRRRRHPPARRHGEAPSPIGAVGGVLDGVTALCVAAAVATADDLRSHIHRLDLGDAALARALALPLWPSAASSIDVQVAPTAPLLQQATPHP